MTLPTHLGIIVSDAVWLALITGASTVVLAWMQKSTKIAIDEGNVKLDVKLNENNSKLDDAREKRAVIHDLVNSNYSELATQVKSSNDRMVTMQELMDKLMEKLNSQETVRAQTSLEAPPAVPATLEKIEEHTEKTAKNTAKTDKAMTDMKAEAKEKK